ncbi:MAG: DUF389 domain-containing protein [Anaerolineales bacterium]|nr:DUF389 domain-containing protein [Anaerolineales bacterium]
MQPNETPSTEPNTTQPGPSLRVRILHILHRVIPKLTLKHRAQVQVVLREASNPDFDYFLLVVLSSIIATFGLITDSAPVIIGAMLVAPLMSPLLGLSLASLNGDEVLLSRAITAILRGAILTVVMGFVLTWIGRYLPFTPLIEPSSQVIAQTHPSPFDLGVSIAGGVAAAFALAMPEISAALPGVAIATAFEPPLCTIGIGLALGDLGMAGGALLLFLTNTAAIVFAGVFTFFILGFRPKQLDIRWRSLPRSLVVSAVLVLVLVIPLIFLSATFVRQGKEEIEIRRTVQLTLDEHHASLVSLETTESEGILEIEITLRSETGFVYEDVVALQQELATSLQRTLAVRVNVIPSLQLDPLIPPTRTATPTPGPTMTITATSTQTATTKPLPSLTSTPTATATSTSTPSSLAVANTGSDVLILRAFPEGPQIGFLQSGDILLQLYEQELLNGMVWIQVQDQAGRTGWVPQYYTVLYSSP